MAGQLARGMRAVALSKYCKPTEYDVATLPVPEITKPDELLIRVHAASINPIDVKMASGLGKMLEKSTFPYKIGYDLAGVVIAVGPTVSLFKPGDEVYSRAPGSYRGSVAEYTLSTQSTTAIKPPSLSFTEAASIPLAAQTALQALDKADKALPGGLKGKTVFVPAGLSGTGSFAVQLAKNVFGAGKVITTLSTGKIPKIKELLGEGATNQIVDYTKEDVIQSIGKGSVDFMFDTMQNTLSTIPVMKQGGQIVSISTVPSGDMVRDRNPNIVFYLRHILNFADWILRSWASWKGVNYTYMFLDGTTEDLDRLSSFVEEGKLKPIVGHTVKLSDVEGVRKGCQQIFDGKGGIGKFVIEMN